jgi:peptide deformylase
MAKLEILIYPDPKLREMCAPVVTIDSSVKRLLEDMAETMYDAPGIGLAASQVGALIRAIVIDLGETGDEENPVPSNLYKIINPEIIDRQGKVDSEEGCLSIPDIRASIKRAEKVTVKYLDEHGKEQIISADGLMGFCLQHEIDHLNGVLFIDHLSRLKRELLNKQLKQLSKNDF